MTQLTIRGDLGLFLRFATVVPVAIALVWAPVVIAQDSEPSDAMVSQDRELVMGLLSELRARQHAQSSVPAADLLAVESTGDDDDAASRTLLLVHKDGRFRQETSGPRESLEGYDGHVCWQRDATGLTKSLAWSDREYLLLLTQLRSGRWLLLADPDSLAISDHGTTDACATFEVRHGRALSRVTVQKDTGYPTRCEYSGTLGPVVCELSDYREHFGWAVPMSVRITDSLGASVSSVLHVRPIGPDEQRTDFAKPASIRGNVTFTAGAAPQLQLTRARTGHALLDVVLDDQQPHTFVFDTGAGGTLLEQKLAETMSLPTVGSQKFAGVYQTGSANLVAGQRLQAGGVTLNEPKYVAMDLDYIRQMMGQDNIMGVVGYDLLSQCVCEIELASNRIRFSDPATFVEQLPWQPITFHQNIPLVPATFPQGQGLFRIDVGAASGEAGNVIFHTPAVEQYRLVGEDAPRAKTGNVEYARGTIEWFELMGHRFDNPHVIFALGDSGPLADPFVDGNIGVEFLKPFRIVLDYQHERVAFLPIDIR